MATLTLYVKVTLTNQPLKSLLETRADQSIAKLLQVSVSIQGSQFGHIYYSSHFSSVACNSTSRKEPAKI